MNTIGKDYKKHGSVTETANLERPFRLGILGAGRIAKIITPMLGAKNIRVTAVYDVDESATAELAHRVDATACRSEYELQDHGEIDGVYIATPPAFHRDSILRFAHVGIPVICEKPWVLNAAEAIEVTEGLFGVSVPVASCASRFRFTPAIESVRQLLAEGTLGRLRQVRMTALVPPVPPIETLQSWKRSSTSIGGGLSTEWCAYEIDWLIAILGSVFDPLEARAVFDDWRREGTTMDSGYDIQVRCASGLDVWLRRRSEVGPREHLVEMRGEHGGADIPFAPDARDRQAKRYQFKDDGETLDATSLGDPVEDWTNILCGPIVDLISAARHGTPVASTPASQERVHQLLDAFAASGKTNGMKVPL